MHMQFVVLPKLILSTVERTIERERARYYNALQSANCTSACVSVQFFAMKIADE